MFLPYSDPSAGPESTWSDYEAGAEVRQATADGNGYAETTFPTVPQDQRWLVDRVVVSTDTDRGTGVAWAFLYVDTVDPRNLVDGTNAGDFDVNDADAPIELDGGSTLVVTWEGAAGGALCTARIHYLIQRQAGS